MENNFFSEIQSFLQQRHVLYLFGKSGTGKTSFMLHFIGWLMTESKPYHEQCVWIQASEFFPSRRLSQLFNEDIERLRYLRNNIFITPFKRPFLSYQEQSKYLSAIGTKIFPPEIRYIVIDNISHHLRFEVSKCSSVSERALLLNKFYESQLLPLVLYCQANDIALALIHEVSYNPSLKRTVPFFYKLYSRIEGIEIELQKDQFIGQNILNMKYLNHNRTIEYQIHENGFQWVTY